MVPFLVVQILVHIIHEIHHQSVHYTNDNIQLAYIAIYTPDTPTDLYAK